MEDSLTIQVKQPDKAMLIGNQIYYLEDTSNQLTITDILSEKYQLGFRKNEKVIFARPATQSAYWLRITLDKHNIDDLALEFNSTFLWHIDFYESIGNTYKKTYQTGGLHSSSSKYKDVNWFWFPLKNKTDNITTYYIRISSGAVMEAPIYIGSEESLYKKKTINDFLTAAFVGIMVIMFLYNFFLFISTKDKLYFPYLGYLVGATINFTYLNGYQFAHFITTGLLTNQWWQEHFLSCIFLMPLFTGVFCIQYLKLKKRLTLAFWLIFIQTIVLAVVYPILNLFFELVYLASSYQVLMLFMGFSCIASGITLWVKGYSEAVFYVLGWGCVLVAAFLFIFSMNGLIPFNVYIRNAMYFGIALEAWFFSLALADRINMLRKANEMLLYNQSVVLEDLVNKRTKELKELNVKVLKQNEEISAQKEAIKLANDNLEQKVIERSQQLNYQNEKFREYSFANAHKVRAPLARIMGLIYLLDKDDKNTTFYYQELYNAVHELDDIVREMNKILEEVDVFEKP